MTDHEVLLIEDDPHIARFISAALRLEGYRVRTAASGVAGLSAAQEHRPAAVITDMMLPGMTGLEILRHLKMNPDTAEIPILVLTASLATSGERDALTLGASAYLRKPISATDLTAAVRRVMAESSPPRGPDFSSTHRQPA